VNAASDLKTQLMLKQRTAEWLKALHRIGVLDIQLKNMRICSVHFKNGKYFIGNKQ